MQNTTTSEETYRRLLEKYADILIRLKKKRSNFGWLRLFIVLAIVLLIYYLFFNAAAYVWLAVAALTAFFLYIVSADTDNNEQIAHIERLHAVNNLEVLIQQGDYYNREDGLSFLPQHHPYANDIDLFGRASIYQYINRCSSEQSKQLLASMLLAGSAKETIIKRQEAAKSLSQHLEWRQDLQSSGMANPLTFSTEKRITAWLKMPAVFQTGIWQTLPSIFTFITLASFGAYLFDLIPSAVFTLLVFVYFLFAKYTSGRIHTTYLALSQIEAEVNTILQQLKQVEKLNASSVLLDFYKQTLVREKNGSESIGELKRILQRFDFRLNVFVFLVLNTFLLWDVRQLNSLNKWKEKNAGSVPAWFDILVNIEVLNTLAILTFNHPEWIFPTVNEDHFTLSGESIGHPLIDKKKRVNNSFVSNGTGKVSVITGSNMAGKSTFLRSIAVNIVLAQIGAPVCANAFTCSLARLYSSMRIADNLAENTSTFYAELKKLKTIIDEVKQHEKVFILLDEILRGTNSLDRHTGSEALIRQLIREKAVAVIATHDVELAGLENQYGEAITNYHFDVQVEGEELYFDYKLKRGVCQSMNASLLMKKIGIEM
jgi:DNA mismatch repair ATPase MutS